MVNYGKFAIGTVVVSFVHIFYTKVFQIELKSLKTFHLVFNSTYAYMQAYLLTRNPQSTGGDIFSSTTSVMNQIFLMPLVRFKLDWNHNNKDIKPFRKFLSIP